ncbi:MAG TPA: helix-turn-helix domain-containing protein [Gemmatimonadaceae bacterium]|nr:helix-turn-helix domain-containing protein [Gemmatimonadaceae bacterium]
MTARQRKAALKRAGVTGTEIAARAGVSQSVASETLNGTRHHEAVKEEIARALGLAYADVWPAVKRRRRESALV